MNGNVNNAERGFNNRTLNSNKDYNNPETVNSGCKVKNTGDYCFKNSTKLVLVVQLFPGYNELTLDPNQTQCFYNFKTGSCNYTIHEKGGVEVGNYYYQSSTSNLPPPF